MRANISKCQHIALNIEYTSEALFIKRFHYMIMLFLYSPTCTKQITVPTRVQHGHSGMVRNGTMEQWLQQETGHVHNQIV